MMETDKNIQSLGVKYLAWLLTNILGRSPRLAPNIARFGFVSVVSLPISLFILHNSWTLHCTGLLIADGRGLEYI